MRGTVAAGVVAGSALLAIPASAHTSYYCGHDQAWDRSNPYTYYESKYKLGYSVGVAHYHEYRHYGYSVATHDLWILHGDVTKACT